MTAAIVIVAVVALAAAAEFAYRHRTAPRRRALRLLDRQLALGWLSRNPRIDLFPLGRRESYFFARLAQRRGVVALRYGPWPDADPMNPGWMVTLYDPQRPDAARLADEDALRERWRATQIFAPAAGREARP